MRKNKTAITIIVVLVIMAIIGGVAFWIYAKTDIMKSDKELFFKYLAKVQVVEEDANQIFKTMEANMNNNYSSEGTATCTIATNDTSTNVSDIQNLFTVKYNVLNNQKLNQVYTDYNLMSNNQVLFTLRTLKDGDTFAIKGDNIVDKYLAIENKNLRELCKKLGIEDTENIPDTIPQISKEELLKIDPDLLTAIKNNYGGIINNNLQANNFTKVNNNDKTTTITLSLTEQEVMNIEKALLEQLKNDDATVNLIIEKANLFGYELNLDSLKTSIQEKIDEITNGQYSNEEEFLKVAVTENGTKTTKLEMKANTKNINYAIDDEEAELKLEKEEQEIIECKLDFSETNRVIVETNDGEEHIRAIIAFGYETNKLEINADMIDMSGETEKNIGRIQYRVSGYNTNKMEQSIGIEVISEEDSKIQISIDNTINFKEDIQIEKITDQNAVILNKMSSEQIQKLFANIFTRLQYLYGDQIGAVSDLL